MKNYNVILLLILLIKIENKNIFPKFKFGKCLLKQKDLLENSLNNELFNYLDLPMFHTPSCSLDDSPQEKGKKVSFASVGVIKDKNGKVLLTRRKDNLSQFPHTWVFPGGKLNKYENFITGLLREIKEETGITISYFNKQFTYNGFSIKIKPIFLYESIFPTKSKTPSHQNFIIFYKISFPIYYKDIKLKINNKEIDAFVWGNINDLYKIIYMNYKGKISGFKYNSESKKYKVADFDYKNFKPNFINMKKEIVDSNDKSEYITHAHRTAIKFLANA